MNSRFIRWGRVALIPLAVTGALLVACSDDEEPEATATEEAMAEAVEVTAVDYRFEGLPESVKAGTKLSLVNSSEAELHELVAILLPEGEERSAEELLALPEEEQAALSSTEPAVVILAAPGTGPEANIVAVGDGTLTAPGRYLVLCAIPVGADPAAYAAAAAASDGGPPQVEGGPPHFVQGMFGELTVE